METDADNEWGDEPPEAPEPRDWAGPIILTSIVVCAAAIGVVMTIESGLKDSAVLFVGVPSILAILIAWFWRAEKNIHAMTFKWITFGMLVAAICLHEGAICVIMAAPVVYLVGHGIAAIAAWEKKRAGALVV